MLYREIQHTVDVAVGDAIESESPFTALIVRWHGDAAKLPELNVSVRDVARSLQVLFGVNLISVKIFGEVEFWFSMIKVTAIIGMIVIGLGVLTLGMMARVALGHTGRPLKPAPAMVAAFVLLNISGVLRGLLPIASPQWFSQLIAAGGVLWVLAFIIFVVVYAPVLAQP